MWPSVNEEYKLIQYVGVLSALLSRANPTAVFPVKETSSAPLAGTSVVCSTDGIDPNNFNSDEEFTFQPNARRRKRSLVSSGRTTMNRRYNSHRKRQTSEMSNAINCDTHTCLNVECDVQRLTTDGISLTFEFNIDERFFGSLTKKENYVISAMGSVSVLDNFVPSGGDDLGDNFDTASVILFSVETESIQLLHVILWPILGALILFVLFVLLLHCLGFFRRKKPEDEDVNDEKDANQLEKKDVNELEITGL